MDPLRSFTSPTKNPKHHQMKQHRTRKSRDEYTDSRPVKKIKTVMDLLISLTPLDDQDAEDILVMNAEDLLDQAKQAVEFANEVDRSSWKDFRLQYCSDAQAPKFFEPDEETLTLFMHTYRLVQRHVIKSHPIADLNNEQRVGFDLLKSKHELVEASLPAFDECHRKSLLLIRDVMLYLADQPPMDNDPEVIRVLADIVQRLQTSS